MKIWGIIATVLLLGALGFGGWLYIQNKDLKSQKSKVETELAAAQAANDQSATKMASASKKIGLLTSIFAGIDSQEESLAIYDVDKSINDETLTADWKAMMNSQPGDDSGNKMMTDLIASAVNDLK